jgi:membrane-associated protease RseP (regulator of RpoE activity)
VSLFGYLSVMVDWSWVVVGVGVAAVMLLPGLGNFSLGVMVGIVAFIGFVHGWVWVVILIGLLVMIFLHELGHFLTARWSGMKATEFFLGFGPKLWSFTRGETEYGVKAIPAGAYVRIIGMTTAEEVPPEDEDRTYRQKSFPKRLLVVSAGSLMHLGQALVAAVVLLVFVGAPGGTLVPIDDHQDGEWIVAEDAVAGSAADAAGLEEGDRVVAWDGERVENFAEVRDKVEASDVGDPVTVTVLRDGETFEVTTDLVDRLLLVEEGQGYLFGGMVVVDELEDGGSVVAWGDTPVSSFADLQEAVADSEVGQTVNVTIEGESENSEVTVALLDDSLSDADDGALTVEEGQSELLPGVVAVGDLEDNGLLVGWDDEPVPTYGELEERFFAADPGDVVPVTVRGRGGETETVSVGIVGRPEEDDDGEATEEEDAVESQPFLGIGPTVEDERLEDQTHSLLGGVSQAGQDTGELLWMTGEGIGSFFSPSSLADFFQTALNGGDDPDPAPQGAAPAVSGEGDGDAREVMSIVGITRVASQVDAVQLLMIFFALNLTIGLINMAPILPLDGGHAIVAVYERLRSRNGMRHFVDADKLMPVAYVGFMLITVISLTAVFLDIVDPITL